MSAGKLRVGKIKFTNALPITHYLDKTDPAFEFVPAAPNELNGWLANGELDVSLISAYSYAQHADRYVALRGLSVSSRGPVWSIQFFSKRKMEELSGCVVALPVTSASSSNLLKILLAEQGVTDVTFITMEPDLPKMLEVAEAALLIADFALHWSVREHGCYMYDLGEVWNRMTGHSMTFAVCAASKKALQERPELVANVHRLFMDSKRQGQQHPEGYIARAAEMLSMPEEFCRDYFAKLIYDFDESMVVGAEAYFDAAYRHGLLEKPVQVELWGDAR